MYNTLTNDMQKKSNIHIEMKKKTKNSQRATSDQSETYSPRGRVKIPQPMHRLEGESKKEQVVRILEMLGNLK